MKKSRSLAVGILLGITAVISTAIVYIDTTQNFWRVGGAGNGYVQLIVSNRLVMSVSTNTGRIGINVTNADTASVEISGIQPATNATGNGASAAVSGAINVNSAAGGGTFSPTTATGGAGGNIFIGTGAGGIAPLATTNSTGGAGGVLTLSGGSGGSATGVATNAATGGLGGGLSITSGSGGSPNVAATNTVGGNGGAYSLGAGSGGTPVNGWARKGGNGGSFAMNAGNGGQGVRTNSGNGGNLTLNAGSSGAITTSGNPGLPGAINLNAGTGQSGDTNGNGGSVYAIGGAAGTGGVDGNTVVGRNISGAARGGLMVGPLTANAATLTNLLQATATLDFGSIAAGTVADLPVTVADAANGDVVTLGVPLESVTNCTWMAFASNGVVYVRAANGQLVTAQDPNSGVFRVVVSKFR